MPVKGILVTLVAPMNDHIANGGEKILGNASSIKQRPDGRVYISGQKQRHALFSSMDRMNEGYSYMRTDGDPSESIPTYISNGDGVNADIATDIRADLGGYLITRGKGNYSGRRTAPLTATPAVAMQPSELGRDLLIRLKVDDSEDGRDQAVATREFSQHDEMLMNFFIDVSAVGVHRRCTYSDQIHMGTTYESVVPADERRRRIALALEATGCLTDYANNARNATSGEPQKVLIVFDTRLSRKTSRYFQSGAIEKRNLLQELRDRGAT